MGNTSDQSLSQEEMTELMLELSKSFDKRPVTPFDAIRVGITFIGAAIDKSLSEGLLDMDSLPKLKEALMYEVGATVDLAVAIRDHIEKHEEGVGTDSN
jgi:hypothetical protein